MAVLLHQRINQRTTFGVLFVAPQHPAIAERAVSQTHGGAGERGVASKKAFAGAAHSRLNLHQASFSGADHLIIGVDVQRVQAGCQFSRLAVRQHGHPVLAGRGICVHSVLHSEFNHVGARQADGVLRRAAFTVTVVKGAHAQQRRQIRDFKTLALFALGAAGADPRLAAS